MTNHMPVQSDIRGFTLVETVIYIGLFGIMFSGIFMSMYPLFTNADRLSRNIATEGETAFVLAKIRYALAHGVVDASHTVTSPAPGTSSSTLIVKNGSTELFRVNEDTTNVFCTPPRVCAVLTYSEDGDPPRPLNAERVSLTDFSVTHVAPVGEVPRYVEVNFKANGTLVGPVRYYLHF
jgi:type II secretory pathway pseudopilin PulG